LHPSGSGGHAPDGSGCAVLRMDARMPHGQDALERPGD